MSTDNVVPTGNKLLVESVVPDNVTSSGIILSGGGENTPYGKIVSVSIPASVGKSIDNTAVYADVYSVGECVLLDWTKVWKVILQGKNYYFVDVANVLGKIKEPN